MLVHADRFGRGTRFIASPVLFQCILEQLFENTTVIHVTVFQFSFKNPPPCRKGYGFRDGSPVPARFSPACVVAAHLRGHGAKRFSWLLWPRRCAAATGSEPVAVCREASPDASCRRSGGVITAGNDGTVALPRCAGRHPSSALRCGALCPAPSRIPAFSPGQGLRYARNIRTGPPLRGAQS